MQTLNCASVFVFVFLVACPVLSNNNNNTELSTVVQSDRSSRFFGIGIVKFENAVCMTGTTNGLYGTCYTRKQCTWVGGVGSGSCAEGIGTCCIVQRTCGNLTTHNNTYFVNPGFPATYSGAISCSITIRKCDIDICQLRIHFLSLSLAQPDGNGYCVNDALYVTGGASTVPVLCGENSGQHIYVNFNGNADITITIQTSAAIAFARSWNIKIAQLGCWCPTLAPPGCLQYYMDLTGNVQSFNYGPTVSGGLVTLPDGMLRPGTRQLANENYGICVQMQPGYCSIQWSQAGDSPYSFTVSGNTTDQSVIVGLPSGGMIGQECTTDYVVIPNPQYVNGTAVGADRFCGNQFPTVMTAAKPFVLTVVTDGDDISDNGNRGFSLNFAQQRCASTRVGVTPQVG